MFGTTNLSAGSLPKEIEIDESQNVHFVQILFILKEKFWKSNQWALFTKRDLENWIYADKSVYLENTPSFGAKFFADSLQKVKRLLKDTVTNLLAKQPYYSLALILSRKH